MNLNKTTVIVVVAFAIVLGVSLYFNFRPRAIPITESDKEVIRLRSVRDSALNFSLQKSISIQNYWQKVAEVRMDKVKELEKKDSTNRFYYEKEKRKIPTYTPATRNHVVDSILRANRLR